MVKDSERKQLRMGDVKEIKETHFQLKLNSQEKGERWNSSSMEWQAWEENGSVSCLWSGIHPCILVEGKKKASGDEQKVQKQDLELIGEDMLFAFPLLSAPWALLEVRALGLVDGQAE